MKKIAVIGSLNMDLITQTDKVPVMGETLSGIGFRTVCGGKGGNQAAAASKLGGDVAMLGCVGGDGFGGELTEALTKVGVDCSRVRHLEGTESGIATITVCNGDNSIIIIAGANGKVDEAYVRENEAFLDGVDLILLQLEIPMPTNQYIVDLACEKKIPVMLNPAPAAALPEGMMEKLFCVIVNETECEFYTGVKITDMESAKEGLQKLLDLGVKQGIVTLGEQGCVFNDGEELCSCPARKVTAVDSTAAGDTFTGAIAVSLMEGKGIKDAIQFATKASSIAVTKMGAQTSIPSREEVEAI